MREAYCGTIGYQFEHLSSHQQRMWLREMDRDRLAPQAADAGREAGAAVAPDRGLPVRALHPEGLPGPEDVLDRGPRRGRADARRDRDAGAAQRRRGGRDRDGPPRPAQRARPQPGALGRVDLRRVRGREGVRRGARDRRSMPHRGTGDVKYHHGAEGMFETRDGEQVKDAPLPQPEPPRVRRPGRHRRGARGPDRALGPAPAPQPQRRRPGPAARRRRLPCPGSRRRDIQPARRSRATRPAGRSTSSPTTRWASRPTPRRRARLRTPSDMAKGYNVPIIHVNADDVEACIAATRLAMAYREKFERDVVIDLIGYRRYGHNETDEAAYTQPKMAAAIKEHPPVSRDLRRAAGQGGRRQRRGRRARRRTSAARSSRPGCKRPAREDGGRRVRGPGVDGDRDRRARPHEEPRGRDRRLREAAALAQRGAAAGSPRASRSTASCASRCSSALETARGGRDRVRPRRGARLRLAAHRGHAHPAHRPGHRARHLLPPPPRPPRREDRPRGTRRSSISPAPWPRSRSTTARSRSRRASASSTATRRRRPRASSSGRRSSATSPTRPR